MGKVIKKKLPEDHPIFKTGWTLRTAKKLVKSNKKNEGLTSEKVSKNL